MRTPKENDCCQVLFEGQQINAKVIRVDNEAKTFNVLNQYGQPQLNIPFDKFNYVETLGNQIVNILEKEYSLDLKTVDAMEMSELVDEIIFDNRWKVYGNI